MKEQITRDQFREATGFSVEVPGAELFRTSTLIVEHPFYKQVYYEFGMKTDKFEGTILELLDANRLHCKDGVIYLKRRGGPSPEKAAQYTALRECHS